MQDLIIALCGFHGHGHDAPGVTDFLELEIDLALILCSPRLEEDPCGFSAVDRPDMLSEEGQLNAPTEGSKEIPVLVNKGLTGIISPGAIEKLQQ